MEMSAQPPRRSAYNQRRAANQASSSNNSKLSWQKSPIAGFYPDTLYSYRPRIMETAETISGYDYGPGRVSTNLAPDLVIRKIMVLIEYHNFDEVARIIHGLPEPTLKAIGQELPVELFIQGIPRTLQALDAVYARVFFSAGVQKFPFNLLKPESVVMQLIRLFAHYEEIHNTRAINWTAADIVACKNILRIIIQVDPKLKRILNRRKKALDKALEGLGIHGMVLTTDHNLINVHDALKMEFKSAIKNYRQVLNKLEELELANPKPKVKSISKGAPPTEASHQRLMSLTQKEVQDRLQKNKTVWTTVEPVLYGNRLPSLLSSLKDRIDADKDAIVQFSQLRQDTGNGQTVIAPILMQYARGFDRVLLLLQEVCDESVSGYHSDSDSVVIPSNPSRNTNRSGKSGSTDGLKTISSDSGRGNSVEASTKKDGAVLGYTGSRSGTGSPSSPVGIPSITTCTNVSNNFNNELTSLKSQIDYLRGELSKSKDVILKLQHKEEMLVNKLTEQTRRKLLEMDIKGEARREERPTHLIRRYADIYMESRMDALQALDNLQEMDESDDLKTKLLFSVIVLAFRSVRSTIEKKKAALRQILGLPVVTPTGPQDAAVTDMLESIGFYMRKTVDKYDVRPNVQDVCSQLYSTLYDFPSLPSCAGLTTYIEECVKIAWALSNQIPAYCIEYESHSFNETMHERYHTSDQYSSRIITYLWPGLTEGEGGSCTYKGIVIT